MEPRQRKEATSIAGRAINWLTDKLGITEAPTYTDGYGVERRSEVPFNESAQGQQLQRMGETAKNVGKLGLMAAGTINPFTAASTASALLGTASTAYGLSLGAQNVYNTGKQFVQDPSSVSNMQLVSASLDAIPFAFGAKRITNGLSNVVIPEISKNIKQIQLATLLDNNIKHANIDSPRLRGYYNAVDELIEPRWIKETHLVDLPTGKDIGQLSTSVKDFQKGTVPYITNLVGTLGFKSVSRDLYNARLLQSHNGLISGEMLLQPEITERVWKHFPFTVIRNNGKRLGALSNGRVVNLNYPTTYIPKTNTSHFIQLDNITKNQNNDKVLSLTGKDFEVYNLVDRYNKWAEFYGYQKIPKNTPLKEIEPLMKSTFDRHNTFYRGLRLPVGEDLTEVKKVLGENATEQDILNYIATTGRKGDTYATPFSNAGIYGNDVAILRRKYRLGEDPQTWLKDADFDYTDTPATQTITTGVNYPWASNMDTKLIPNEIRFIPEEFEHVGWMPKTVFDPELGWLVDPDNFKGSLNVYINPTKGTKPKFKQGGKINEDNTNRN